MGDLRTVREGSDPEAWKIPAADGADAKPAPQSGPEKARTPGEILLKADQVTLAIRADHNGRLRLNANAWSEAKVTAPGETIELRHEHGQVWVVRKRAT